jgi:soluble lytic murein transglycosylase-like protein
MGGFAAAEYRLSLPFAFLPPTHNGGVKRTIIVLSAVAYSFACATARADIYSFIDESGTAHYSNVPADNRYQVLLVAAKEPTQAGEVVNPHVLLAALKSYDSFIETAARQHSVEPALLRAVIVVESGFNTKAISKAGARGLMQLMPATAKRYGVRNSYDPRQNIQGGARYLSDLLKRYRNDLELVLAAYNAGETAVERYGRSIPPFSETRHYVPRVLGIYEALRNAAKAG